MRARTHAWGKGGGGVAAYHAQHGVAMGVERIQEDRVAAPARQQAAAVEQQHDRLQRPCAAA